ncbi:MAG: hypothetical protein HYR96_07770 [Deltaproteobacteria bacterium]|nr:hypothetical protein [Deltaproteobacteria bacterium]MBI3296381.1 hypothetical protein [Deltaproteobacteria bacterium]
MGRVTRREDIRRKRARRSKIKKLKARLLKASPTQVQAIAEKIKRISPFYPLSTEK